MNTDDPDLPGTRPLASTDDASVVGLLRQLSREVPALFTKELALAKVELQTSLNTLKAGIAAVAGGAIVFLAGFIILLMAAVYGLSLFMAPWLAALIVGVVVMIIGFAMLQSGKNSSSHPTSNLTGHSMP
jgi:xanthine/uracil permease